MSSWWCNALFHFLFAEDVRYADWFRYVLKYNLLVYYLTVCNSLVTYHIDGKLRNLFLKQFLSEISSSGNLIWQIFESTSHSKHKTRFSLPKCKTSLLICTYWPSAWVTGRENKWPYVMRCGPCSCSSWSLPDDRGPNIFPSGPTSLSQWVFYHMTSDLTLLTPTSNL